MRRWSGLCYGIGTLLVVPGPIFRGIQQVATDRSISQGGGSVIGIRGGSFQLRQFEAQVPADFARSAVNWSWITGAACLGAAILLLGLILWIRETRAARRVDAGPVFE